MRKIQLFLLVLIFATLTACVTTTTQKGMVGIDRQQLMLVSPQEMEAGSIKAYSKILAEAKKNNALNPDPKQLQRIRNIANRLIPKTSAFRSDAPHWNWEVNIIKSDQINAWCMPGGKIVFYTGIIEKLDLTDAEIAAIMGHEIAHALREHGRERASHAQMQGLGLALLGAATGAQASTLELTSMIMDVTFNLPNSREHEIEADRMGVELAARAGFNPYAAVDFWKKMKQKSQGSPPEFMSTHPSHENRIQDLKNYAGRVKGLYLANRS